MTIEQSVYCNLYLKLFKNLINISKYKAKALLIAKLWSRVSNAFCLCRMKNFFFSVKFGFSEPIFILRSASMEVGSAYSGLQAFDMVSKSVEMLNELTKTIAQEDVRLDRKVVDAAVRQQVSHPSQPQDVHQVDVLA